MRRRLAITGIITAGLTALALASGPALAQGTFGNIGPGIGGPGTCPFGNSTTTGNGYGGGMMGNGPGNGDGGGMMGNGASNGYGGGMMGYGLAAKGTLTTVQKATLVSLAEEEKLAHDVYVALAARYPSDYQFARISRAETMHQAALRNLMARYGITDPTAGQAAGTFTSSRFRTLYSDLLTQATSAENALAVGIAVEKADIADLTSALDGLTAPDATQVYTNLRTASQRHLALFGG